MLIVKMTYECIQDTSGISDTSPDTSPDDITGTPLVSREHVKIRRPLADEMRNAVWFFAEHGRPRVQLGELLDEAVAAWLQQMKQAHNEGHDFPHRGRLR
jgi:hypothetical protein